MSLPPQLVALIANANGKNQYAKQLSRVTTLGQQIDCIEAAVDGVLAKLPTAKAAALVVYGDPQSGKTEMMICLTARLLDGGYSIIVHLLNDSVDLLAQSLDRFREAGLAPAPRNATDLVQSPLVIGHNAVLFCKKNAKDLEKLIDSLSGTNSLVIIDDEADYATPNAKINKQEKTRINDLVGQLLGDDGKYIGVTATPARLNLNNTFNNKAEMWVQFHPHSAYTGQDTFFPQAGSVQYRLSLIKDGADMKTAAHKALARFLVSVGDLNTAAMAAEATEKNYSMLVHTSGNTNDHNNDKRIFEDAMSSLVTQAGPEFEELISVVYEQAGKLYSTDRADVLTEYVLANASRSSVIVLNSKRDRASAGDRPTVPTTPFTVIIGGNIVSRGVTFPNLLSMFFTRDVKTKLQQDTYIQRARMFGARSKYLSHFELNIPENLYADWHRCFVLHRLALQSIKSTNTSPVWMGDARIAIASASSIDHGTVDQQKGEMSFKMFDLHDVQSLDAIVTTGPQSVATLEGIHASIGEALPRYLVDYLTVAATTEPNCIVVHKCSSIANYKSEQEVTNISRTKGFIGRSQLELGKYPNAVHHIKIFFNTSGKARVFYKNLGGVQFVQNMAE